MTFSQPIMADVLYYQQSGDESASLGADCLVISHFWKAPWKFLLNSFVSIKRLYDNYPLWSAFVFKRNPVWNVESYWNLPSQKPHWPPDQWQPLVGRPSPVSLQIFLQSSFWFLLDPLLCCLNNAQARYKIIEWGNALVCKGPCIIQLQPPCHIKESFPTAGFSSPSMCH